MPARASGVLGEACCLAARARCYGAENGRELDGRRNGLASVWGVLVQAWGLVRWQSGGGPTRCYGDEPEWPTTCRRPRRCRCPQGRRGCSARRVVWLRGRDATAPRTTVSRTAVGTDSRACGDSAYGSPVGASGNWLTRLFGPT